MMVADVADIRAYRLFVHLIFMNKQPTRPDWLRIIRFCYRCTFVLFGLAAINMIPGIAYRDSGYVIYSYYVLGAAILICAIVVNLYPILFLRELYEGQEKERFRFGLFAFVLLNIVTGYLWYFTREIRGNKSPWAHEWMP